MKEIKRIPYDNWITSQLSVAKYYGGIDINGDYYEWDREVVTAMKNSKDDNEFFKPDLVLYEVNKKII